MAKRNHMLFDKSEITCIFLDGANSMKDAPKKACLRYNDIQSVSIKPCRERKGLKVRDSERILIRVGKLPRPIEFYKLKEEPYFDDYKAGLRLFCRSNRIKLYDEVED